MPELSVPAATCRLQFNHMFRFEDACRLVPYLYRLGISDIYASPISKARRGSLHGYDIIDPSVISQELGGEADFEVLVREIKSCGMGLLIDIVPNHMVAGPENPWWQDVQDKGKGSIYSGYFDTDWLSFGGEESRHSGHRHFFDIGDLVGIRVEDNTVFEAVHSLIIRLAAEGKITGLRIDHIDGLYDPLEYLLRLQQSLAPPHKITNKTGFYVVVEKILSGKETLPVEWPVSGTTGYDFAGTLNALFVDPTGAEALNGIYSRFTGLEADFNPVIYEKKKLVMRQLFDGEMRALGQYLGWLAQQEGPTASLPLGKLTGALIEIIACLPVYRTYTRGLEVSDRDKNYLENAKNEAVRQDPEIDGDTLDFLQRVLTLDFPPDATVGTKNAWLRFVMKWQQLTGAVMAKGFEDTALYCYNRLLSLNEVGSAPASPGLSVDEFHRFNLERLEHWPYSLNATSTHDTKRSEDVRARINVLSEVTWEWERRLDLWSSWNANRKTTVRGLNVPEPNTEMFIYQTLLGAWPLHNEEVPDFKERLKAYMVKAVREAKTYTNWLSPDAEYEAAVAVFLDSILDSSHSNNFLEDFLQFEERVAFYGALNSLSQLLLKITSPGVPDFYQGTELWDFSLVDPDNRRPVDYIKRIELLNELIRLEGQGQDVLIENVLKHWQDGRVKLYVTCKALNARRTDENVFRDGSYLPLRTIGRRPGYLCAFARCKEDMWFLTVVPRLITGLVGLGSFPCGRHVWGDDMLVLPPDAPPDWMNFFTGQKLAVSDRRKQLPLAEILSHFPVALLSSVT